MTKTEAIALALENVTDVDRFGEGWNFQAFSTRHRMWSVPSHGLSYSAAVDQRTQLVAAIAASLYLGDPEIAGQYDAYPGFSGSVRKRLNAIIAHEQRWGSSS